MMLQKNLVLSGTRSEHIISIPTIYRYVTVLNHSRHRLSFFPGNVTDVSALLYRVPAQIYATLPLVGGGTVETCQRTISYTVVSEGENVVPVNIMLLFSDDLEAINIPFPDPIEQPPAPGVPERNLNPQIVEIFNVNMPLANTEYSLSLPAGSKKVDLGVIGGDGSFNYRVAYTAGRVAAPTAPFIQLLGSQVYFAHGIFLPSATNIFFACSTAGRVMQIEVWRG